MKVKKGVHLKKVSMRATKNPGFKKKKKNYKFDAYS